MAETSTQGFEILDHPADMGFRAWAPSREELFVVAARGLTEILVDLDSIEPETHVDIEIEGDDDEMLLYNWLSEVLFLFDADGLLFSKFESLSFMTTDSGVKLTARMHGREFSRATQQVKTYVKAITLHQLKVERNENLFCARVYLDI